MNKNHIADWKKHVDLQVAYFCNLKMLMMAGIHLLWNLWLEGGIDECVYGWVNLKCKFSGPADVFTLSSSFLGIVITLCSLFLDCTSLLNWMMCSLDVLLCARVIFPLPSWGVVLFLMLWFRTSRNYDFFILHPYSCLAWF